MYHYLYIYLLKAFWRFHSHSSWYSSIWNATIFILPILIRPLMEIAWTWKLIYLILGLWTQCLQLYSGVHFIAWLFVFKIILFVCFIFVMVWYEFHTMLQINELIENLVYFDFLVILRMNYLTLVSKEILNVRT